MLPCNCIFFHFFLIFFLANTTKPSTTGGKTYIKKTDLDTEADGNHLVFLSNLKPFTKYQNPYTIVRSSFYPLQILRRVVILRKRVIRRINKSKYKAHIDPIFKKLNLLKFQGIHLVQLCQFMGLFKKTCPPSKI